MGLLQLVLPRRSEKARVMTIDIVAPRSRELTPLEATGGTGCKLATGANASEIENATNIILPSGWGYGKLNSVSEDVASALAQLVLRACSRRRMQIYAHFITESIERVDRSRAVPTTLRPCSEAGTLEGLLVVVMVVPYWYGR